MSQNRNLELQGASKSELNKPSLLYSEGSTEVIYVGNRICEGN